MSTSTLVHGERNNLADLLLAVGPDAPTLCEGWTARDLAAHVVIREGRPDAAVGIVVAQLANWTSKVQAEAAARPYDELVATLRQGPPRWSPFSIAAVDAAANIVEFAVHAEDVRRAQPNWTPRADDPELNEVLYKRATKMGRVALRGVSLGVEIQRTDVPAAAFAIKTGSPIVTLTGSPLDLVMRLYGRTEVSVQVTGAADAVAIFNSADLSL
ncbi:MAG: TIGR03085 family metal-binding protein [Candidatus Nanopelagicales bacterium]